jgi:hypothetical protein
MQKKSNHAIKSSLAGKIGIALMALSCVGGVGLIACAAQAQDLRSLPGLLKGGKPQQNETGSTPAQQPQSAPQVAGSAEQSGSGQGSVAFANKALAGMSLNVAANDNEAHKGAIIGRFSGGGATDYFNIYVYNESGSKILEFKMETVAADVQKPRSFTLRGRKGKPATAEILYQNVGIVCKASAGTVNITAAGAVGGNVAGNISGIEWFQGDECVKALGTSATFTVQRANDYQR